MKVLLADDHRLLLEGLTNLLRSRGIEVPLAAPEVLFIGIDPEQNRAAVWAGRQVEELSTSGLVRLIEGRRARVRSTRLRLETESDSASPP